MEMPITCTFPCARDTRGLHVCGHLPQQVTDTKSYCQLTASCKRFGGPDLLTSSLLRTYTYKPLLLLSYPLTLHLQRMPSLLPVRATSPCTALVGWLKHLSKPRNFSVLCWEELPPLLECIMLSQLHSPLLPDDDGSS